MPEFNDRRNPKPVFQGESPLDYSSSSWVKPKRLAMVDENAGDPPASQFGFTEQRRVERYGRNGRPLKKTRITVTAPPAAPGTVSYVDYSLHQDTLKIHYMGTRQDRTRQGLAKKAVEHLVRQHPDVRDVDFGKVMSEHSEKIRQHIEKTFPDKSVRGKKWW